MAVKVSQGLAALTFATAALLTGAAVRSPAAHAQASTSLPADVVDVAAAKKEGRVVWYSSTPVENATRIAKAFEAETGITVELFRTGGSAVLRRFMQEVSAGRVAADVLTTSDPAGFSTLVKRGLLVPFRPANLDKLPAAGRDKDGHYFAQRLNLISIYARSDKVPEAALPRNWDDLLAPRFKGQMIMTDPAYTSLQLSVVGMLSRLKGWGFYERLRQNDIMIVQGNQQVAENIRRAERVIAAGASDSYATDDRRAGHPVVTIFPADGSFIIPSPTAVIKGGPNPNAAKLLAQFMLSETVQGFFPQEGGYAARSDIRPPEGNPPLAQIKTIDIDYDFIEAEGARIKKRFAEVFQ